MSRDFSIPYTPEELEGLKEIFRGIPSYKPGGWILASDLPELIRSIGLPRTAEQQVAYKDYWEKNFAGILTMEDFLVHASHLHSTSKFARDYVIKIDADKDGFINADQFKELIELMQMHDPKLKAISFEDFVLDAGTNNDGKVSIDACVDWFERMNPSQSE